MTTVEWHIKNADTLLRERGLEPNGRIQKMFTSVCAKYMDDYVPMAQGVLKNSRIIDIDNVVFNTPYARYQYYGEMYIDPIYGKGAFFSQDYGFWSRPGVKKVPSGIPLRYHGSPKRGKLWDKRMWQDNKDMILTDMANAIGGVKE